MQYFYQLNVPANTPQTAQVQLPIKLECGILDYIDIGFPDWVCELVGVVVICHSLQIGPFNKTGYIVGNNRIIRLVKDYELIQPPFEILVSAFNLDDTYDHTISIDIMVSPAKPKSAMQLLLGM